MNPEVPIPSHPKLPEGVPLVAGFHDDRNRLSYYYPILRETSVRTPVTMFVDIEGDTQSIPEVEPRRITQFMQDVETRQAFIRSDFSSAKYGGDDGSKIDSQDPVVIESVISECIRQHVLSGRHLGGRLAVREWIPHDAEVRYFVRDGKVVYWASLDDVHSPPDGAATTVADVFDTFAWSVDFIRHKRTGSWYCIDMGLDGLYHNGSEWIAISEHLEEGHSPEQHADEMPDPDAFRF